MFKHNILKTGLFFARFKKTQSRKKLAQKKNSRQILAKNSRYRSHLNILPKKNSRFFHYQGPILIDFEAKIRFLRHILLKLSKIRLSWQNVMDIGKKLKAFGKKTQ